MKNWWLLPLGLFFGLWLSERERRQSLEHQSSVQKTVKQERAAQPITSAPEPPAKRDSRTLEELSPLYKDHKENQHRLYHFGSTKIASYIHNLTAQLIQPEMTELEAKRVQEEISFLMRDALGYESDHEEYRKKQQDTWIEETEDLDDESAESL